MSIRPRTGTRRLKSPGPALAITGLVLASIALIAPVESAEPIRTVKPLPYSHESLLTPKVRDTYTGKSLREIRFPIGGVGAGNIAMNGKGALVDWEVGDRPNAQSRPDFTFIGLRIEEPRGAKPKFRILEGRITERLMGDGPAMFSGGGYGMGVRYAIAAGLPRYRNAKFIGRFPFAKVLLTDPGFPVAAELEGWSPFIPSNSDDSSLPVAIVNVKLTNTSDKKLAAKLSFSQQNLVGGVTQIETTDNFTRVIAGARQSDKQMTYTIGAKALGSTLRWHRAAWHGQGGFNYYVKDFVQKGKLPPHSSGAGGISTVAVAFELEPGETKTIPYIITWYLPDCQGVKRHYAARFKTAAAVSNYLLKHRKRLETRTRDFQKCLFDTNVPGVITEAVSSQLAVLRSQTMFRMTGGGLWGWEGCAQNRGCCHGTCLHVWHYAQSIAHLFPDIERNTRQWDYNHRMTPDGHMAFRLKASAPPRPTRRPGPAAADGQFGTIMRVYREWQISGDSAWLKKIWPDVKKSLEYAWKAWDPDRDGMMTQPQHNTLDLNLSSWNTFTGSMYQAALLACEKMARAAGDDKSADAYRKLFENARKLTDKHLFNGEYYFQRTSPAGRQYNNGCISEQLIGQWWSSMMGLGYIYGRDNIRKSLGSLFKYNFLESCEEHFNTSCVFQLNDDAGVLICSWPKGGRPREDLFYADTFMVGYEDQVAANLIYEGYVLEGLAVTKATRDRHNGSKRNPYSQPQAGNYYARSLANYSQLLAITGFRYSAVDKAIWLGPKVRRDNLKMFFSTGKAWGKIIFQEKPDGSCTVNINPAYGSFELDKLYIDGREHNVGGKEISPKSGLVFTTKAIRR